MNWTGKLAQIFIRNGNLSLLIVISVFIWGIFSFILTPKQYNPKITAPSFQVVINYPGAVITSYSIHYTKLYDCF